MMKIWIRTLACLSFILIFTGAAPAQQQELPSYLNAEHRGVLQKWLAKNPKYRVATDQDCGQCAAEITSQRRISGADYHPYYAVGDFNNDGRKDFAIALIEVVVVRRKWAAQKFAVAVFNAPFSGRGNPTPAFFKNDLNLKDGGLFFGPSTAQPNRLFIALFGSDQGLTVIPQGRKYVGQ